MTTVLITAIGGDIAQGIATIFRETFPDWRLIGSEIHQRHGGELFVDAVHVAPLASDAGYANWLGELISREQVDFCIPMSEAELIILAAHETRTLAGARMIMANSAAIDVGSDKLATARFLTSIGCAAPWTIAAEDFDESTSLPCIFKPRRSAGSKAVYLCADATEVEFYRRRNPHSVLQEYLERSDSEVTCAIFRSRDGEIAVLQLLRSLVGGTTGWAQVIDDPAILGQCISLAEGLRLHGSINAQLRVANSGPKIFEINPRFSSTVLMRHRMGFRDLVWSIQDALGQREQYRAPTVRTTAARVHGAALLTPLDPSVSA